MNQVEPLPWAVAGAKALSVLLVFIGTTKVVP
jgi:hypothetical protein